MSTVVGAPFLCVLVWILFSGRDSPMPEVAPLGTGGGVYPIGCVLLEVCCCVWQCFCVSVVCFLCLLLCPLQCVR